MLTSATPGITVTMESQRQGQKNFKNFYSQSEVFFHNVEYWAGYTTEKDWAFKTPGEILEGKADHFTRLKNKVISLLLLARLEAFGDLGMIKTILSNQPAEAESKAEKKTREKEEKSTIDGMVKKVLGSAALLQWEQENVANFKKQYNQREPGRMEWNVRHAQHPKSFPFDSLAAVFMGLSHTHFNWMASTNKTDHVEHRKRIVRAVVKEEHYWNLMRADAIENNEHLFRLFSQLSNTIASFPLFKSWELWLPFSKPLEKGVSIGDVKEGGDDTRIQEQAVKAYQMGKREKLLKIYEGFVRNLNHAGLCGVADGTGVQLLHPGLKQPLEILEKVISPNSLTPPLLTASLDRVRHPKRPS